MITRIRLEASAPTDTAVRNELVAAAASIRHDAGGKWSEEEPGLEVQTTSRGFWGRYTLRRERDE